MPARVSNAVLVASRLKANCGTDSHMAAKGNRVWRPHHPPEGYICTGYRHLVTTNYRVSHDENGVGATVAIVEYATDPGASPGSRPRYLRVHSLAR
jgi:hypothetical protein